MEAQVSEIFLSI